MSKYTIYSPSGVALYTGTPTYTGSYRKPGMLEFREINSPEYIDFAPGCYVDYDRITDRVTVGGETTNVPRRFKIYTVPQVKKQARNETYGGAFVYQSVQLFDASKELEYCPFRDLVKGDNRVHFSTQPSISTFESVSGSSETGEAGLAARFQACLEDIYGAGSWHVRTATVGDGASSSLVELMAEPREFTVSGLNLLECLDKVFDIWPEVGWVYRRERHSNQVLDTIIIGGGGSDMPGGVSFAYGKGKGLKSITRTVANADELANRIFAYGSQRNMSSDWYRNQRGVKDADSIDIQHLMIPVEHWGSTGGYRDAAKAYVENTPSVGRNGLRIRTAYFDGTEDLPEIYPTIEGMTIGDVTDATPDYTPDATIWTDPDERVDVLAGADTFTDSGYSGANGKSRLQSLQLPIEGGSPGGVIAGWLVNYSYEIFSYTLVAGDVNFNLQAKFDLSGTFTAQPTAKFAQMRFIISTPGVAVESEDEEEEPEEPEDIILAQNLIPLDKPADSPWVIVGGDVSLANASVAEGTNIYIKAVLEATFTPLPNDVNRPFSIHWDAGNAQIYQTAYRSKTFHVTLKQLGFDIGAQGDLGDGKVISMRTGMCQGRSFSIKEVIYQPETDTWDLECYRSEDESIDQWFPNRTFPVVAGDRFVLLDIAMPDSYIYAAENRLYEAANDLLSDTSTERWQYTPDVDAKFMVDNEWRGLRILPGQMMTIEDGQIVDGTEDASYLVQHGGGFFKTSKSQKILLEGGSKTSMLVDTVVISEGESTIPTYKVTLLDKKRKVFTEAKSVSEYTAKSVANSTEVQTSKASSGSAFFELCEDGSVKLKDEYIGLWAAGWISAGGVSEEGGGGGGGNYVAGDGINILNNTISLKVASASTLGGIKVGSGLSIDGNGVLSVSGAGSGFVTIDTQQTVTGQKTFTATLYSHKIYPTSNNTYSLGASAYRWSNIYGVDGNLTGDLTMSASSHIDIGPVRLEYDGSTGVNALHITTNDSTYHPTISLYADGFVAAGGIGTPGGGGGGGGVSSVTITSGTGISVSDSGVPITSDGERTVSISSTYQGYIANGNTAYGWGNHANAGYVTLTGTQTISGAKTFSTNAVTIDSSSSLSVASYIDIGDARLVYDSGSKALHVQNRDGVGDVIGFFADGFVAGGGTAAQSTASFVTVNGGTQSIRGGKTFESVVNADRNLLLCSNENAKVIIGANPGSSNYYKLYVDGEAYASSWITPSDRKLKKDITPLSGKEAIAAIMAFEPCTWKWNSGSMENRISVGLIAQDVEKIVPYMVSGDENKSMNYQMLHGFELSAIQDHETRLRALEAKEEKV